MRSNSSGVALRPCDAASEPAAAGAEVMIGAFLGPFQNLTRRAKRRPATRAASSTQSWRRMALRFVGVQRGRGLQCSGACSVSARPSAARSNAITMVEQACRQCNEPLAARSRLVGAIGMQQYREALMAFLRRKQATQRRKSSKLHAS